MGATPLTFMSCENVCYDRTYIRCLGIKYTHCSDVLLWKEILKAYV